MHEQIMNCISQFYTDQGGIRNGLICGIRNEMNRPDFNVKGQPLARLEVSSFLLILRIMQWVNVKLLKARWVLLRE
jgi:hypothetical protein